ncbi:CHAP domain-containing protein, partial [Lactococcus petauri]|nr:CHAP domain-containing protein [Lactococcus petauri]
VIEQNYTGTGYVPSPNGVERRTRSYLQYVNYAIRITKENENKGDEEEMMLLKIVDTTGPHKGKWFISNGTHLRYIRTPRMLASYQNQYAKMNLKTDNIYSSELFGKKGEFDEKNVIW